MKNSRVGSALALLVLAACGNDPDSNTVGELSWSFDYSNWTAASPSPSPRACVNGPESSYLDVAEVGLSIVDPTGQRPGVDDTFACDSGAVPIRGLARSVFDVTLTARSSDGVELYRFNERDVDFSTDYTGERVLLAAVGEIAFRPQLNGEQACADGVMMFRVSGTLEGDAQPTVGLTQPACAGAFFNEVIVRNIPVEPRAANGGFVLPRYSFFIEAVDSENTVVACGAFEQAVAPGEPSISSGDPDLSAAGCP